MGEQLIKLKDRPFSESSIDKANMELLEVAREGNIETVFDRVKSQEPKCNFCATGISCRNCNMGPCRITPNASKGVCGATADTIVARSLLQNTMGGASSHMDHARHVAIALYETGLGKAPYKIKNEKKLRDIAKALGMENTDSREKNDLAVSVAQRAFHDLGRQYGEGTFQWLKMYATKERIDTWEKLGVLPTGGSVTISEGMHSRTMGVDADPANLVLRCVKTGIVDGYAGLHMSTDLQDILFGPPQVKQTEAGIGVMKENSVNIACHGHVPILSEKIVEAAERLDNEARSVGAEGINVIGMCCTGNEILARQGIPQGGNELNQETAIITGAMDLMVVDYQCIFPAVVPVAEHFHTKIITTASIAKIPGAEHVQFEEHRADQIADEIVKKAIDNFKNRDDSKVHIPRHKSSLISGFSPEAILDVLSKINPEDPLKPLIDNIASGNIRGAVAIVGCNNPRVTHDYMHVNIAKELIKQNVLVIGTGCAATAHAKEGLMKPEGYKQAGKKLQTVLKALGGAAGLEALPPVLHFGSCVDNSRIEVLLRALADKLGVAIKDLPVVASAPEYTTEKALSIGTWAVAIGVTTHVYPPPRISGSPIVTKLLTHDAESLLGSKFFVSGDPKETARIMVEHIDEKRRGLGLPV